ncbi:hypothetical protein BV911_09885 [Pseudoruegeria sp. SK021]|nr:hypothetical protein BV911_09885 [Pseudoruegeria sp. SK021]
MEVGAFIQLAAQVECAIDRIAYLSLDVFEEFTLEFFPRFPQNFPDKIKLIQNLLSDDAASPLASFDIKGGAALPKLLESIIDRRNSVCHGKMANFIDGNVTYSVSFVRIGRVRKGTDGRSYTPKITQNFDRDDIFSAMKDCGSALHSLEECRIAIWQSSEGWPMSLANLEVGEGQTFDVFAALG